MSLETGQGLEPNEILNQKLRGVDVFCPVKCVNSEVDGY
jgi:hypothetical protein